MPSPNCPPEASQFLARLRTSFYALPLKDTCALGMSKLDEVCSQEGKAQGWNEVSRAHLIFLVILHLRHLGGIGAILEIESKIDNKLEAVGHALDQKGASADLQIKEAFFVLQKAKMSVLADRSAYGYHSKPLVAIHSRFDEQARRALFAESREACKAYISLLCLNFETDYDAFQMSDKQVQANIDLAMSLNSEFLEAKHSYSKYTPKIQIWQLKNAAYLPSDSVSALLDDLLARFPEGKHAISLYTFKSEQKTTQKNRIVNQETNDVLKSLIEMHQASARKELGIETSEEDHIFYPTRFDNLTKSVKISSERSERKMVLANLERLRHHRSKTTGLPREEDYELLLREALTIGMNPEFMIPELIDALQLLLAKHRKVSTLYEKVNCYHDFKILAILENVQRLFETNPRIGAKYPAVAEFEAEAGRLITKLKEADDAIRKEEGPDFSCFYNEYLYGTLKSSELQAKADSKLGLEKLREELTSRHSELLRQIEAGETKLTYNCIAIGILETLLITVLTLLQVHDSKYSKEMKSLIEHKLSKAVDFYGTLEPVVLYFESQEKNDTLTSAENEEVLALLKEVNSDQFPPCEHAEVLRQFEVKATSFKLQEMMMNFAATNAQLQMMLPSAPEYITLQKRYEDEKKAFADIVEKEDARRKSHHEAREEERVTRMTRLRIMSEDIEFQRMFFPFLMEQQRMKEVMMNVGVQTLQFYDMFFKEIQDRAPDEFEVLCLTEEFLSHKAKYEFRKATDYLDRGSLLLRDFVTLSSEPKQNKALLELHKKKCRMMARQFPKVDSIILDFEQQIAFDKQQPQFGPKVESYQSWVSTLKLVQATKLFLEMDPSNLLEAVAKYNEFKDEIVRFSPEAQQGLQMEFNLELIVYFQDLGAFKQWAEENWKYAKYLPKIQRPSMKTVMVATLVLGAAAVAWFKATSVKK